MIVYLRCSSPFSNSFLPVTCQELKNIISVRVSTGVYIEKLQLKLSKKASMQYAPEHTHLCVNYNIIKAPPCDNFQGCCVGNILDRDQVSQQPLHFATVPPSLWVPLGKQRYIQHPLKVQIINQQ